MFNLALSLISSLQAGARIKQSFERSLRQAVIAAIAAVVALLIASCCLSSWITAYGRLSPEARR